MAEDPLLTTFSGIGLRHWGSVLKKNVNTPADLLPVLKKASGTDMLAMDPADMIPFHSGTTHSFRAAQRKEAPKPFASSILYIFFHPLSFDDCIVYLLRIW